MAAPDPTNLAQALASASATQPVWVRAGELLDGGCGQPLRPAHLVYDAAGIRYAGPDDRPPVREILRPGQSAPDVDLPGYTVLPGLIDAHTHLFLDGAPVDLGVRKEYLERSPAQFLERAAGRLQKLIGLGVTGMRDAGDRAGVGPALQAGYRENGKNGTLWPYIDSPGAGIHHKGRYGAFFATPIENYGSPEDCVEARRAEGAYRIKLVPTGIINLEKGGVFAAPQMTRDELEVFVRAARARGMQTLAHASGEQGVGYAIEAGVDSIEHGYFITTEQLAGLRDRGAAWVPTFAPVQAQLDNAAELGWGQQVITNLRKILDGHAASLRLACRMGVAVVAGSDAGSAGVPHGLGLLRELELMEQAGMPTLAVIHAATGGSAARLGYGDPIGRLAPGAKARLIFIGNAPLQTVASLRRERITVFDGRAFTSHGNEQTDGL